MKKLQTLTVNGVTYEVSDPNAATQEDIGEISAALDAIIEIQSNLIGGDGE